MPAPRPIAARVIQALVATLAAMLVIGATVANQSAVHWRDNRADDHLFVYGGWRILNGERPYADVWDNKPPGIWWVNALALALGGEGVLPPILAAATAQLARCAAFVWAARLAFGRGLTLPSALLAACVLTSLRYECGANRTETYMAAAEIIGVALYLAWRRSRSLPWLAAAGLVLGTAPWFKQNGLAAGAACGLHLAAAAIIERAGHAGISRQVLRPLVVFVTGLALPTAGVLATFAFQGVLEASWEALVEFNRYHFTVGSATWTRFTPFRVWSMLAPLADLRYLALLGMGCGVWVALRQALGRHVARLHSSAGSEMRVAAPSQAHQLGHAVALLLLWLLGAAYLACVAVGQLEYHLSPLLTPVALLALCPLGVWMSGRTLEQTILATSITAFFLVVYGALAAPMARDSLHAAAGCWGKKPSWYALEMRPPGDEEQRGAVIQAWTTRDERIYVWGWSPGTYRFAYRKCPSRFATLEAVSHIAPHGEFIVRGAVRDLRANPPAVFVISPGDYVGLGPDMAPWLAENYLLRETIGGMHLFLRRDKTLIAEEGRSMSPE